MERCKDTGWTARMIHSNNDNNENKNNNNNDNRDNDNNENDEKKYLNQIFTMMIDMML